MINCGFISVIIPSLNGQKFIKKAIESVISQSYEFWELILIDDGSTDDTAKIMKEYSDLYSNISFYQHSQRKGLSSALNKGFSLAKGDYFTWISDDNIFKNDALEEMIKTIQDSDIVYSDYELIDENESFISKQKVGKSSNLMFHYSIGPCFLYKSQCHHKVGGYNESFKMCEDYDFFLKLYYNNFCFKKIDKNLFSFRIHKNQMSSDNKSLTLATEKIIIQSAQQNFEKISNKNLSKIYLSRFLKNKYNFRIEFLLKAFCYSPFYTSLKIHKVFIAFLSKFLFLINQN